MAERRCIVRRSIPSIVLAVIAFLFAGCGPAIAVGLLASKSSGGGGGGANSPAGVAAAVQSGTTGFIAFDFTLVDPESDTVSIEIRRSLDANEDATKPFAAMATGTYTRLSDGQVLSASALTTSPAGTLYRFMWDTAQDVGTLRVDAARLQVLLGGAITFTTATFAVDNTQVPMVTLAVPGALPSGATIYADEQRSLGGSDPGFIPIQVTLADLVSVKLYQDMPVNYRSYYYPYGYWGYPYYYGYPYGWYGYPYGRFGMGVGGTWSMY